MRLRRTSVALAAVLALVGLAGCRTNVGTAAYVNGTRITETDVNDYITPTGAVSGSQTGSPRSLVLTYLVQQQVFEAILRRLDNGSLPNAGVVASYHDTAARILFGTTLTGRRLDAAVTKGLPRSGVRASFTAVYLRATELEYAIIKQKKLTKLSELAALVKKVGVQVSVIPRYGRWQPAQLAVDGKVPTPPYLSVAPGSPTTK